MTKRVKTCERDCPKCFITRPQGTVVGLKTSRERVGMQPVNAAWGIANTQQEQNQNVNHFFFYVVYGFRKILRLQERPLMLMGIPVLTDDVLPRARTELEDIFPIVRVDTQDQSTPDDIRLSHHTPPPKALLFKQSSHIAYCTKHTLLLSTLTILLEKNNLFSF